MKSIRKIFSIVVFLSMLLSLLPAAAFAQDDLPTQAVVNPAGTPPETLYKWELVDMQPGTGAKVVEYLPAGGADIHDADMATPLLQVKPNLEDWPEVLWLDYWWVVTDPNGLEDIIDGFIRVYHPDGSLKYQLHGTIQPCAAFGTATTVGTPLEAAVHTGQVTVAQADAIVENCGKRMWRVYRVVGELSKHQPAGVYTVNASAVDQAGNTSSLVNQNITVLPVVGLVIDFLQGIDFGQILPNTAKWARGDFNFGTSTLPTVKNTGNSLMYLRLNFGPMTGVQYAKVINEFDAMLDVTNNSIVDGIWLETIPANTEQCFSNALGSNVLGQIDFSIHPRSIPGDTYRGAIDIWGSLTPCNQI